MCPARLELLPPGVLDISLSQLTYDDLARANCVSKAVCEGVQLVVSSLARRLNLGAHLDQLGTGWLRQMDLGLRSRVAMCYYNGLLVVDCLLQLWEATTRTPSFPRRSSS